MSALIRMQSYDTVHAPLAGELPGLVTCLDPDERPELVLGDSLREHLLGGQPVFR
jgi:hypothetical protein